MKELAFEAWKTECSDDNKTNHKSYFSIFTQNTLKKQMRPRSKWWVEKKEKEETIFAFPLPVPKQRKVKAVLAGGEKVCIACKF